MAIKLMRNAIESMDMIGAELARPYFLSLLAEGYAEDGKIEEGLDVLEQAYRKSKLNEERWYDSGLYLLLGKLSEAREGSENNPAANYRQAIEIAKRQEAKSFEMQGGIALVKAGEGREALEEVYKWYGEGFDSDLLIEAKGLIN